MKSKLLLLISAFSFQLSPFALAAGTEGMSYDPDTGVIRSPSNTGVHNFDFATNAIRLNNITLTPPASPTTFTLGSGTTTSITGGGTLALGGFTFTVPATGTAVLTTRVLTAGAGLTGGGDLSSDRTFTLGTPSTNGVSSTNSVTGTTHTHAITSSSNPGASASLLATDSTGALTLTGLFGTTQQLFTQVLGDKVSFFGSLAGAHYGVGVQSSQLQIFTADSGSQVAFGYGSSGAFTRTGYLDGSGNFVTSGYHFINAPTANLYLKDTSTGFQAASTTVITPQSGNAFRSTNYQSGLIGGIGWNISDTGNAEFNNVDVRGAIHAAVLAYNEVLTTAGTQLVTKSAGKLKSDVTIPASPTYTTTTVNIDIVDSDGLTHASSQLFLVNDILWLKDGVTGSTWLKVSSASDQTTFWRYTCTIQAGTNNVTYRAALGVADYGQAGDGIIVLTADQTNAPYMQMATNVGTFTANNSSGTLNITPQTRYGQLNGSYGYASSTFGFGAGQYGTSGKSWITADTTNGIRIGNNTTTLGQWDNSGQIFIGSSASGQGNIFMSGGTFEVRVGSSAVAHLDAAGNNIFGQTGTGQGNVFVSGGTMEMRVGTTAIGHWDAAGNFNVGQSGVGNNISIDTTNGLQIKNGATTLGQWDTSGDATFGQLATNKANLYWNNSNQRLEFRGGTSGTSVQSYIDTDGSFVAGGGNTKLNASGVSLTPWTTSVGVTPGTTIKWGTTGEIGVDDVQSVHIAGKTQSSFFPSTAVALHAQAVNSGINGAGAHFRIDNNVSAQSYARVWSDSATFAGLAVGSSTTPTHMLDVYGTGWFQNNLTAAQTIIAGGNVHAAGTIRVTGFDAASAPAYTGAGVEMRTVSGAGDFLAFDRTNGVTIPFNFSGSSFKFSSGNVRFANYGAGTLVTDASGNITASSDETLKDIDGNYTRGLADLRGIQPISYHWKAATGLDRTEAYSGFGARNVLANIPEAVSISPDGTYALNERPIVAALVNAVNELDAKVSRLANEPPAQPQDRTPLAKKRYADLRAALATRKAAEPKPPPTSPVSPTPNSQFTKPTPGH